LRLLTKLAEVISNVKYYLFHGYSLDINDDRIIITRVSNWDDWKKEIPINAKIHKAIKREFGI